MGKSIIAGNWKMNLGKNEAIELVSKLKDNFKNPKSEIIVCPPFIHISEIRNVVQNTPIKIGSQNVHFEDKGAFTGEISMEMLKDYDVDYVIIGHSERRHVFNETDDMINKKMKKVISSGLVPIFCVGELLEERENDKHFEVVREQVLKGLEDIELTNSEQIVIAYEPVWAIGTGKNAEPKDAYEMHKFIREVMAEKYNEELANSLAILYGGSVKPDNIDGFMIISQIDGVLVGGASLKYDDFERIIRYKSSGC